MSVRGLPLRREPQEVASAVTLLVVMERRGQTLARVKSAGCHFQNGV
jgi:hypothetical protein